MKISHYTKKILKEIAQKNIVREGLSNQEFKNKWMQEYQDYIEEYKHFLNESEI